MNDHQRILRLRPANVVGRLGQDSTLPILEPRRLGRALVEKGVPLLCVPVLLPPVMAGLLRAARELDAVIGLCCPALYEHPVAAEAFITALKNEGEGLHRKPFFLQAGPLRLSSSSPAALEQAYAVACMLLDAGFSLLSLDGSRLGVANSVQACRDLVQATMGKGVAVELTAPRNAGGRTSPEGLRNYLQSLEKAGARPDFMRVGVPLPEDAPHPDGLDTTLLGELAAMASNFGVELTVADRGRTHPSEFIKWAQVGVRKLDAGDTFSRIVLDVLPEEVSKGLLAQAQESQIPVADLLGASEEILQGLDARTQERLEALSFADALSLLGALRAANSATESMSWLIENGLHPH
jgi:hypothetical protein